MNQRDCKWLSRLLLSTFLIAGGVQRGRTQDKSAQDTDNKPVAVSAPVQVVGQERYRWGNAVFGGVEYCTNIIFNPKHSELVYARNDTGSIHRLDRKNNRWVSLMDNIPFKWSQLFVADSFALDANDPNTLYVATGGGRWGNLYDVLKTTDGGQHWQRCNLRTPEGKEVFADAGGDEKPAAERLAVDPNDSRVVWYGTRSDGLFRSADAGKTWQRFDKFPKGGLRVGISFVTLDWKHGKAGVPTPIVYVGVHAGKVSDEPNAADALGGVYRSDNGGKTWVNITGIDGMLANPHLAPIRGRVGLDGAFYVTFSSGEGFWKYQNGAWTNLTPPAGREANGRAKAFSGIGLHPTDPQQLMTLTYDHHTPIFYSRDGGKTWLNYLYNGGKGNIKIGFQPAWERDNPDYNWPTGYCATIDFDQLDPTVAYESDFSGANRLTGMGSPNVTVSLISEGREQMTCGDVFSPSAGAPLISGVWDVGSFRHTDLNKIPERSIPIIKRDAKGNWGEHVWQDLFQIDGCPLKPNDIVAAGGWQWNNTGDAAYSEDNGQTWHEFPTKPFADAKFGRIAVGTDPNNVVWGPMGDSQSPLYATKDRGKTWQAGVGGPLGTIATNGPWSFYKMLAADRVKPGVFYAFDRRDGRFFRSEDGGFHWKHVSRLPTQEGAHYDTHKIQAAPTIAGVVWASLRDRGLFASNNSGASWTKLTGVAWAEQFAWGKGKPGGKFPAVYLLGQIGGTEKEIHDVRAADVQLYRSDDMGRTWTRINDEGHQFAGAGSITGDGQVWGRVYICSGGRGVWVGAPAAAQQAAHR